MQVIPAGDEVGEGIVWDFRRQALWWTDIPGRRLHRFDWASQTGEVVKTPFRLGSFGLVAGTDTFIAAFECGVALYEPYTMQVTWLAQPEVDVDGVRFNDGRVDRRGRFWCGTMVEAAGSPVRGNLYSIAGTGSIRCHVRGVRISNGLCMSPDGSRLYFADSPTGLINVFDLIEPEGTLGPPRPFAQSTDGAVPDGATVDSEGCLWSAQWGGGCVVRYTPDGRLDRTIKVPATQPTCVCFGGPDLDLLFVTSAREGLDADTLRSQPHAGDVFVIRAGARGLPEEEYRL